MAITQRLESQVLGLNQAIRNATDGQALPDTAEGAQNEVVNLLQRLRQLAVQSAMIQILQLIDFISKKKQIKS